MNYKERLQTTILSYLKNDIRMKGIDFNFYVDEAKFTLYSDVYLLDYETHKKHVMATLNDLFDTNKVNIINKSKAIFDLNFKISDCNLSKINKMMVFQ